MLRRHFTLGGICTSVVGLLHASAFAQRQVISSNGSGLEASKPEPLEEITCLCANAEACNSPTTDVHIPPKVK